VAKLREFQPNDEKFRELVLYVATKSASDRTFAATKLNKLLFFSDFLAYRSLGEPITGHRYQKLPRGPTPVALLPIVRELEMEGACEWVERVHFGRKQRVLVALREPDVSVLSAEEVALVDDVIQELWGQNAREVSDLSHEFPGWKAAKMQDDIPYETVFVLPSRPLTVEEIEYGRQLLATARG